VSGWLLVVSGRLAHRGAWKRPYHGAWNNEEAQEVSMTASAVQGPGWSEPDIPTEELARRQGVRPISAVDELAEPDAFESDEELAEFLADLYASRRTDQA